MQENIHNYDDLLTMLDSFLREPEPFWDDFFSDREKSVPIFMNAPDENLVSYIDSGTITRGKVLELGCGPGRNAIYLAEHGFEVDAVDVSKTSLDWAKERADEKNVNIQFFHQNIFEFEVEQGKYDFIYDSGCFHHIAPHRRLSYIKLIERALKHRGYFGITCFHQGGKLGGSEISDWEVYRRGSLMGGLGYTEKRLIHAFHSLQPIEIRKMIDKDDSENLFGASDLLTGLFQKR
ncbi:SAM-dependent methyltransferase [Bacillus sp. AFS015802]|uniref:class I SAM-dependent methyltransferase n=1 Tax=Bacillus sp. AFS015802 TaxID=2033486 RepID=UPI000BF68F1F|nr:class I SAM-dependent methyltransferase [Bacillus sp. AFS015802]PFA67114.1 SAM-dependent methyltransferase [Bacillus sp. AFS015802]